jgi:hypothetical protein
MLSIISLLLDDPALLRAMHFRFEDSPVISHPCNTQGWKEYEEYARRLGSQSGKGYLMLAPAVFIDGFRPNNSRPDVELNGIYFTLFNLPTRLLEKATRYRFPLALVPAGCDLRAVLQHVVVDPLRKLEQGMQLHRRRLGPIDVCGSLFALLGKSICIICC